MDNKILQLYQLLRSFKEGVYSLKELALEKDSELLQQLATLFFLSIKIDDEKVILSSDDEKKLKIIPAEKLAHIRFIESLRNEENSNEKRKQFNQNLELLYETIFSFSKIPADVMNWALNQDDFDLELLNTISHSIDESISIGIRYFSLHSVETTLRKLDPYFLKHYKGQVYLIAYCHKHQDIRTFLLSRIKGITETYDHFKKKFNLNEDSLFRYSVGIYIGDQEPKWIQIKCNNHLLPILKEHPIHKSQQILLDTTDYFSVKVQLVITDELIRSLMQFGADIEVLYPASLREDILLKLEKMKQLYSK